MNNHLTLCIENSAVMNAVCDVISFRYKILSQSLPVCECFEWKLVFCYVTCDAMYSTEV